MIVDIPTISAITALIAVIIGPAVSLYITRRQIRASVVSVNRQRWIDQLRDLVAEFITSVNFLNVHVASKHLSEADIIERFQGAFLVEMKINLMLNPLENDHKLLSETIRSAVVEVFTPKESRDSEKIVSLTNSIMQQGQSVLKDEWERVKKGK